MLSITKKFWSRVKKSNRCWIWTGTKTGHPKRLYGTIYFQGKPIQAHRLSWFIKYGQQPKLNVLHKCDNPPCVRPSHLFLGTQKDNMMDAARKGRLIPWNANKKRCHNGHALIGSNLIFYKRKGKKNLGHTCRTCKLENNRRYYWKEKIATRL